MSPQEQTLYRLQNLQYHRQQLQAVETALQELTPEERLVAQMLLIAPQKGNADRLCEMLELERSSIYRRRQSVLSKLSRTLYPPGGAR